MKTLLYIILIGFNAGFYLDALHGGQTGMAILYAAGVAFTVLGLFFSRVQRKQRRG
jgi:hypothetical protein